ncbi:MAG: EpsG family protein [Clostridia bacterium]|nr:EpsG family protein [Clostridia bacterium]
MAYVIVLGAMALLRFLLPRDTERNRRVFATLCCFLLVSLAALRAPTVGRDTALFLDVFERLDDRPLLDALGYSNWVEPGFKLLCTLIGFFTDNGQWLTVVTSVIIHTSVSFFIYKHAKNIYLGFFLYMGMMIYPLYTNTMRQALAVSVLLFAWGLFKKKRFLWYSLLVLLAASFHVSALLFLFCPILTLIPVNKRTLRVLLPLTAGLALLGRLLVLPAVRLAGRIFPRYADYEVTRFLALYGFFAVFLAVTAYGIWRLYYRPLTPIEGEAAPERGIDVRGFLTLMMLLGVILAAMMTGFGQLQRMFNYFEVLYLLWIPLAAPPAFFGEKERHLALPVELIAILLATLAYFFFLLFFRSAVWYDALPYTFFWQ